MNNKTIFAFFMGATIGSIATWKFLKTKYERIAQEEIDSVKETYSKNHKEIEESDEDSDESEPAPINEIDDKPDLAIYTAKLKEQGYLSTDSNIEKGGTDDMDKPYVISPEEYGEIDGYDLYSYVYYADKVLADENNEPIEDVDQIIGFESLKHFGEYGDDSVYVRNDNLKADYEILLDNEKHSDLFFCVESPRPAEEE